MIIDNTELEMAAIVPAAGMGTRLGKGPKAFLQVGERTLLEIVVEKLEQIVPRIIVGAPEGMCGPFEDILNGRAECYEGGKTRQETVCRLFEQCHEEYVLVHDVASPFTRREIFLQVIERAVRSGAASSFFSSSLPVGLLDKGSVHKYYPKEGIAISRTPQVFRNKILKDALEKAIHEGREFQSVSQAVVNAGYRIDPVFTEPLDIKITTLLDWEISGKVIAPMLGL